VGGDKLEGTEHIIVITDANVLIDYAASNKKVLKLLPEIFNKVFVPIDIVKEVKELTSDEIHGFEFVLYYPDADTYYKASNARNGISFEDNICIIDAVKNKWSVITNDGRMRNKCRDENVGLIWGLQLMLILVEKGKLSKSEALRTVEKIHEVNKRITRVVVEEFRGKLGKM
jgi:rRNA-processing protein FCF1